MDISITIDSICNCGNHVDLAVSKDGGPFRIFRFNKRDFVGEIDDYDTAVIVLIRNRIKTLGYNASTPLSTIRSAIESEVFKL